MFDKYFLNLEYKFLSFILKILKFNEATLFSDFWGMNIYREYVHSLPKQNYSQKFKLEHRFGFIKISVYFHINALNSYAENNPKFVNMKQFSSRMFYFTDMSKTHKWKRFITQYSEQKSEKYPITAVIMPVCGDENDILYGIVDGNHRATKACIENSTPVVRTILTNILPQEVFCNQKSWLTYLMLSDYCLIISHIHDKDTYIRIQALLDSYL